MINPQHYNQLKCLYYSENLQMKLLNIIDKMLLIVEEKTMHRMVQINRYLKILLAPSHSLSQCNISKLLFNNQPKSKKRKVKWLSQIRLNLPLFFKKQIPLFLQQETFSNQKKIKMILLRKEKKKKKKQRNKIMIS